MLPWAHALTVEQPLPTLPLWLSDNLAVPLELEASYEETCRILGFQRTAARHPSEHHKTIWIAARSIRVQFSLNSFPPRSSQSR